MRAARLAVAHARSRRALQRAMCTARRATAEVVGEGNQALTTVATLARHTFSVDLPASEGGRGSAATPAQHLLGSLVGCQQAALHTAAAERNVGSLWLRCRGVSPMLASCPALQALVTDGLRTVPQVTLGTVRWAAEGRYGAESPQVDRAAPSLALVSATAEVCSGPRLRMSLPVAPCHKGPPLPVSPALRCPLKALLHKRCFW